MPSYVARLRSLLERGRKALLPSGEAISKVPILDMLAHNWYLGFTSFGGPAVHFQIFRRLFVEKYQWIDETVYQEMFALCQALSGPGSTKMLYAINVLHYGFWTGIAAFFVWCLPMAIAAFGLALGVEQIDKKLPGPVYALLSGLNSATVGIIALAAYQLSDKAITDTLSRILVFVSAAAGTLYNALWYFPLLMVGGGLATVIWDLKLLQRVYRATRPSRPRPATPQAQDAELRSFEQAEIQSSVRSRPNVQSHAPDRHSPISSPSPSSHSHPETHTSLTTSWKLGAAIIAAFLASFAIVMTCRGIYGGSNRGFVSQDAKTPS